MYNLYSNILFIVYYLFSKIYIVQYKSIKYIEHNKIIDITRIYYFKYLLNKIFLLSDNKKYLYQIHSKKYDKYFIELTNMDTIIKSDELTEKSVEIKVPRSLLIKYDIEINGNKLELNDKILYKKYAYDSKLTDIFKFNKIDIKEIIIYMNNKEFKKYIENIETIQLKDIYKYL